jgi:molybdenum cofactor cytidylyltransferase
MPAIVGILLAAGASTRFGSNKLLAPLPDGTAVAAAAARVLGAAVRDVVAVVRPDDDALRRILEAEGARIAVCERAADGMGFSLAAGVAAAANGDGWVVALADMPWIEPATVGRVAGHLARGAQLVAPAYRGQRGHPVGFAGGFRAELLDCAGDLGARALIQRHAAQLEILDVEDEGVVSDIDVLADLPPRC